MRLFVLSLFLSLSVQANTDFIYSIPDFTQSELKDPSVDKGKQFCAPVAVSNSLSWLAGLEHEQENMIYQLSSKDFMRTSLKNGTGTKGVMKGVDRLARILFGKYERLEYQGWRKYAKQFQFGGKIPQLNDIKQAVSHKSSAWLNIGWYKFHADKNEYERIGGHWVTLVGYDYDKLILHDPSPRAGIPFANEMVKYETLYSGTLTGKKKGLPRDTSGYLSLTEGLDMKPNADFAIIDGVVFFSL